jgi:hypothetical protein
MCGALMLHLLFFGKIIESVSVILFLFLNFIGDFIELQIILLI